MMIPRMYRLSETLQRIDHALRREQERSLPNPLTLVRLRRLKLRAKTLIGRVMRRSATA